MAQIKNTFVKSKMNKDLDARLMPNGEYREGRNINVSRSEGSDVGALENILGNISIVTSFIDSLSVGIPSNALPLEIIGLFSDTDTSSLYIFLTSYSDSSKDQLSNRADLFPAYCYICRIQYNGNLSLAEQDRYGFTVLAKGNWLNLSKTHPILGFNIIEGLMFWTDNRNQPRKLNIGEAMKYPGDSTEPYYFNEDQISVAKYFPYNAIELVKNTGSVASPVWESTVETPLSEWLPISLTAPTSSIANDNLEFVAGTTPSGKPIFTGTTATNNNISDFFNKPSSASYPLIKIQNIDKPNTVDLYVWETLGGTVKVSLNKTLSQQDNVPSGWATSGDLISFQLRNPEFDSGFGGDKNFIKDKFLKFSYRFKYDDNEYSLMAPFTQPIFVPENYGSFLINEEDNAVNNTELNFFENKANKIGLNINLPYYGGNSNAVASKNKSLQNNLKIKEIEILFKSSSDQNIYSIESIDIENGIPDVLLVNPTSSQDSLNSQFLYVYEGRKPYKVLPENDITRVNDIVPVRALAQETSGNRIMYANYLNNHGAPTNLKYETSVSAKTTSFNSANNPPISTSEKTTVKEYYNNTLKQGRNYQAGIVLSDRYGRQSSVILADEVSDYGTGAENKSTVFAPYTDGGLSGVLNFFGNSLKVNLFAPGIPQSITNVNNYPGLYSATNPLGWYSYKIVVKQQEQDYYNVYLPGSVSGNIVYKDNETALSYSNIYSISNLSIYGDNINKIPKDLTNVGATDQIYGSKESLYFRVIQPNTTGSIYGSVTENKWNSEQAGNKGLVLESTVVSIQPFLDLGTWTTQKGVTGSISYPGGHENPTGTFVPGTTDPFVKSDNNPYIANIDHSLMKYRIGFFESAQVPSSPTVPPFTSFFSKSLIVAETKAKVSNLDLYWETATSGLVSTLNTQIATGGNSTAPKRVSTFSFSFDESVLYDGLSAAKSILQQDITIICKNNNATTNPNYSIALNKVTARGSGSDLDVTNLFDLIRNVNTSPSLDTYNLYINENHRDYYYDQPTDNIWNNEFIFEFTLIIPNEISIPWVERNNFLSNRAPAWTSAMVNPSPVEPNDSTFSDNWSFSTNGEKNFAWVNLPLWNKIGSGHSAQWNPKTNNGIERNEKWRLATGSPPGAKPVFKFFDNGSYAESQTSSRPYIRKIETAIFSSGGTNKTNWNEFIMDPSISNSFHRRSRSASISGVNSNFENYYVYNKYPFVVNKHLNASGEFVYFLQLNEELNGYYFPFCQYGSNNKKITNAVGYGPNGVTNRFWPKGDLNGGEYLGWKIYIAVTEDFGTPPLTSAANTDQVVYAKQYQ